MKRFNNKKVGRSLARFSISFCKQISRCYVGMCKYFYAFRTIALHRLGRYITSLEFNPVRYGASVILLTTWASTLFSIKLGTSIAAVSAFWDTIYAECMAIGCRRCNPYSSHCLFSGQGPILMGLTDFNTQIPISETAQTGLVSDSGSKWNEVTPIYFDIIF